MAASSDSGAMHRAQTLLSHLTAAGQRSANNSAAPSSAASPYVYTKDPRRVLSDEQRRHYDEHGFLLVKRLVSESEIGVWRDRFVAIANGDVEATPTMLVMRDVAIAKRKEKGERAITKLQDWQDDEILFSYTSHPAVCKYVEAVIGTDFKSVHTMLINKPPDVGGGSSRHPPHQDLWYFPFRDGPEEGPAEAGKEKCNRIVASWTAMQHIDRENGCLFVKVTAATPDSCNAFHGWTVGPIV